MPATTEESRSLKRFALIILNCVAPGLGNSILVSPRRIGILVGWLIAQIVLHNPFVYFAFLIGSVAFGLFELNNMPVRGRLTPVEPVSPEDLKPNTYLGKVDQENKATDSFERKQLIAAKLLEQEAKDEEILEASTLKPGANYFDPTVPLQQSFRRADFEDPGEQSWIQQQLQQTLQSQTDPSMPSVPPEQQLQDQDQWAQQQTDPSTPIQINSSSQQDPWAQQLTDPSLPLHNQPAEQGHDPWRQQMTDPSTPLENQESSGAANENFDAAAPDAVTDFGVTTLGLSNIESTGSLLSEPERSDILDMMKSANYSSGLSSIGDPTTTPIMSAAGTGEDKDQKCHSCGYKRDHDFAFCPQCATMF